MRLAPFGSNGRGVYSCEFLDRVGCKHPNHVRRFTSAGRAAIQRSPIKCEGVSSATGERCRNLPVGGFKGGHRFCRHHMNLRQREAIMSARYAEMQAIYDRRGENGALGKMAADWLRTRAKNNLHLAWESDPTVEGRTCHLPPELERKAIDFLLKHNLDLSKPDEVTGEKLSYRAVDRALWAYELHRQGKISDTSVAKRVNLLLRQERQQMAKLAKLPKWDQA